ncbi:uncharacterized protein LOC131329007 [Rhododendron vialii]|uniref:uncharacterized protein LOC131329007 n=1 Tax=Rhododendron vialii TaxID=182163 RepID=UPI00265E3D70|nr:uncharacterized protein LOC131329007 [Rhododendron vialii]
MSFREFPEPYILWVKACITSPSFFVIINGELMGYFSGKRGLRQGDPISPYLFLLVMEAFSSILRLRISQEGFSFHPRCAAINLSHLVFPDDMFILRGAEVDSFRVINGQWCSQGVPFFLRCQLISSVLFSIQVYWSSVFIIPTKMTKVIKAMLGAFLWNGVALKSVGVKVTWQSEEDILWVKWVHSYISKYQCIWNMHLPIDSSWTLRKIFGLRDMGLRFIKSVVGNGKNTFLWLDNWQTLGPLFLRFGNRVVFNTGRSLGAKVDSIIANGRWKWPRGRNASIIEIKAGTASDLVPAMDRDDKVV